MKRYEVIAAKQWENPDGQTASIYGACPWGSGDDRQGWELKVVGWTIRDNERGTVGLGKKPFTVREVAETLAQGMNERPKLNEVLSSLGYTTRSGEATYAKRIDRNGEEVFAGTVNSVWAWLRETGQIT